MSSPEVVKDVVVVVDEKEERPESSLSPAKEWQPSMKRKMPWIGLTALFFVVLLSIGQVLILLFADRRSAYDWPEYISPNVCLSILNGLASLAIAFAVVQGIAIAWWRKALLGASIKELHYTWNFSASITSIFMKYKYFNVIALAALMAKVAIIDGILFQRSIQTYVTISLQEPTEKSSSVHAWSSTKWPKTGRTGPNIDSFGQLEWEYSNLVANWLSVGFGVNRPANEVRYCYGAACLYGLNGTGFAVTCQDRNATDNFVIDAVNASAPSNKTIFDVSFDIIYPNAAKPYNWIQMNSTWPVTEIDPTSQEAKCPRTFTTTTCELRPAILNYTTFFTNTSSVERSKMKSADKFADLKAQTSMGFSGAQLSYSCANGTEASWGSQFYGQDDYTDRDCGKFLSGHNQIKGVEVQSTIDLEEPWAPGVTSSLQGILNTLKDNFQSKATLVHTFGEWAVTLNNSFPSLVGESLPDDITSCNYTYMDPRKIIITRLNLLMSQLSTYPPIFDSEDSQTSKGEYITNQNAPSKQYWKDIYYTCDFVFMGAALGLTFLVVLCILPSYWGFWQLGRDVTLGPLEIAYAFQGPAFESVHGVNGQADVVVKTVGRTRVQYGEIEDSEGKRLGFKMA